MNSIEKKRKSVKDKLKQKLNTKQSFNKTRTVLVGKTANSTTYDDLYVNGDINRVWVRPIENPSDFFWVKYYGTTQLLFNLAVTVGRSDIDQFREEQIIGIGGGIQSFGISPTSQNPITGLSPHGHQHRFGGGDETFVDSPQFLPGLVSPTNPPSMKLKVGSFSHHWDEFRRFGGSTTNDLTSYIPPSGSRYVTISLNPETNELSYTAGASIVYTGTSQLTFDQFLNYGNSSSSEALPPSAPSTHYPLAAVLLKNSTSTLGWNSNETGGCNIYPQTRLHLAPPMESILSRLDYLESSDSGTNVDSTLTTTGAESPGGVGTYADFEEMASSPPSPSTDKWRLYFKDDGLYYLDDNGVETKVSTGSNSSEKEIWLPANSMWPSSTSGCSQPFQSTYGNKEVWLAEFSSSANQYAEATLWMPSNWDTDVSLTFKASWTSGSGTGSVNWSVQGNSYNDGDTIDSAPAGTTSISDAYQSASVLNITGKSSSINIGGSLTQDSILTLKIGRNAVSDSFSANAYLMGIKIFYNEV